VVSARSQHPGPIAPETAGSSTNCSGDGSATRFSTDRAIEQEVFAHDVVIGGRSGPGAKRTKLVTREMLKSMQQGSVIVNVAIDQGGCFETSHATTHADPTYVSTESSLTAWRICPARFRLRRAMLNNATLPFGLAIANHGFCGGEAEPHLLAGLNVHRGHIANKRWPKVLACPARRCGHDCRLRCMRNSQDGKSAC